MARLWGSPTGSLQSLEELAGNEAVPVSYSVDTAVRVDEELLHEKCACLDKLVLDVVVAQEGGWALLGAMTDVLAHLRRLTWGFRSIGPGLIEVQHPLAPGTGRLVGTQFLVHLPLGISGQLPCHS